MAKAKAICTCRTCGNKFEVVKNCFNRSDADNFEQYAKETYTECKDCYRARIEEENASKAKTIIEKYGFPTITGVSDKQTDYANRLRDEYLAKCDEDDIEYVAVEYPEVLKTEDAKTYLQDIADTKFGGNIEKAKIDFLKQYNYYDIWVLLSESNAGKVIDLLKY